MDYGFAAYSSNDASIVLSSDTHNAFFIGKGTLVDTINGPFDKYYWGQLALRYRKFRLPATTLPPTVYVTTPTNCYVDVGSMYYSAPYWYVHILCKGTAYTALPEVYAFVSSEEYYNDTPAPGYGMQLFNSNQDCTFDSRWGKKLLVLDDSRPITKSNGYSTTYNNAIVKPAVAFSAKYVRFLQSGSYHLAAYSMGVNLASGTIQVAHSIAGFQLFLFNGATFIYYNGFFDPGSGWVPQQVDWSALAATFNNGEVGSLPIIDGAYYD